MGSRPSAPLQGLTAERWRRMALAAPAVRDLDHARAARRGRGTRPVSAPATGAGRRPGSRARTAATRGRLPAADVATIVERVAGLVGVPAAAAAALHARESGRWLIALTGPDGSGVVVKIGRPDDEGLARERSMLDELATRVTRLQIPRLRWHGLIEDRLVIVTDIATRRRAHPEPDLDEARRGGVRARNRERRLRRARRSGAVEHRAHRRRTRAHRLGGRPLRGGPAPRPRPLPARAGALLRAWKPDTAVRHLTGPGPAGPRYLAEIGRGPKRHPSISFATCAARGRRARHRRFAVTRSRWPRRSRRPRRSRTSALETGALARSCRSTTATANRAARMQSRPPKPISFAEMRPRGDRASRHQPERRRRRGREPGGGPVEPGERREMRRAIRRAPRPTSRTSTTPGSRCRHRSSAHCPEPTFPSS